MSTAAIVGGTVAGSLGGALISSSGANKAANTQASAADYAATLQQQTASAALAENMRQFDIGQQNMQPWLQGGNAGLQALEYGYGLLQPGGVTSSTAASNPTATSFGGATASGLNAPIISGTADNVLGGGRGVAAMPRRPWGDLAPDALPGDIPPPPIPVSPAGTVPDPTTGGQTTAGVPQKASGPAPGYLLQPFGETFQAPSGSTIAQDPGYQFRLQTGMDAVDRQAAARGGLLTGGQLKAQQDYSQGLASTEYNNAWTRAMNEFEQRYNIFNTGQTNTVNRLAALSGIGQTSANSFAMLGANEANTNAAISQNSANAISQQVNNAAAARASGYAASANAFGNAFSSLPSGLTNLYLASQYLNNSPAPAPALADPSICWIAAELYGGWTAPKTNLVREWLWKAYRYTPAGARFCDWYLSNGERVAELIRVNTSLRARWGRVFDRFLARAIAWKGLEA
jgi:hypothetical protein